MQRGSPSAQPARLVESPLSDLRQCEGAQWEEGVQASGLAI